MQAEPVEIPIVFCADINYGRYLPVCIQSLIENSSKENFYHIIILDCGISKEDILCVENIVAGFDHFSIELKSIENWIAQHEVAFQGSGYITKAAYGRFAIPDLCKKYKKIIYTDIDVIFNRDVAELFFTELGDCCFAGVVDLMHDAEHILIPSANEYSKNILKFGDSYKRINSGVLLIDIKNWQDYNVSQKCISCLSDKKMILMDQDALNFVCKGKIFYLDPKWNCMVYTYYALPFIERLAKKDGYSLLLLKQWQEAWDNNKVVFHYNGPVKPWNDYSILKSEYWWKFAAQTVLFPMLLYTCWRIDSSIERPLAIKVYDKKYSFFGIPVWSVKRVRSGKRYGIGSLRLAKTKEGRENTYLYILGIKCAAIRRKSS